MLHFGTVLAGLLIEGRKHWLWEENGQRVSSHCLLGLGQFLWTQCGIFAPAISKVVAGNNPTVDGTVTVSDTACTAISCGPMMQSSVSMAHTLAPTFDP